MFLQDLISKINLRYSFAVIIAAILIWIYILMFFSQDYVATIKILDTVKSKRSELNNILRNDCEPIFKNKQQYSVNLDGQLYPKHVYLYQNISINFDC